MFFYIPLLLSTHATDIRVHRAGPQLKIVVAWIYFLVIAIFIASKLWVWCLFNHFSQGFFYFYYV